MYKTHSVKASEIQREWWVVDADGLILGRLAAEVAHVLRGKHKPVFAPHLDTGDHVVIVNADKVRLSGNKLADKKWYRHSGYPGGLRELPYDRLMQERPQLVVEKAIKGMLPRNRLGRSMSSKLKVYSGPDHPHAAQNPKTMTIKRKESGSTGAA
ncbi:MAG TPA: 50S ribosomal protein L13 [Actinomycetota bacterium]|nr:50S ribosomal protein L13 [Actinomycetota bacterium]